MTEITKRQIEITLENLTLGDLRLLIGMTSDGKKMSDSDTLTMLDLFDKVVVGGINTVKLTEINDLAVALREKMTDALSGKQGTPEGN